MSTSGMAYGNVMSYLAPVLPLFYIFSHRHGNSNFRSLYQWRHQSIDQLDDSLDLLGK